MKKNEIIYCCNCGKKGHNYKTCLSPIISYGIILYHKLENEDIKYLMIQRKDTIGFIEFMRGKYNLDNYKYISEIFKIMTKKERLYIVNNEFDVLWDMLWFKSRSKHSKNNMSEYNTSKDKFNILKKGILIENRIVTLESINRGTPFVYNTPEWGFPKGRRNLYETDLRCAIREFEEETNISQEYYNIVDYNKTFIETFHGTNHIKYRHIYYLGELIKDIDVKINKNNINQISEISNINWYNFTDGYQIIRPYNLEKKKVLKYINNHINKYLENK